MIEYVLTQAKLNRLTAKRMGRIPKCEVCGKTLDEFINENISANTISGRQKYYCPNCNVDRRRI